MHRFLFWNLNRKPLTTVVANLAVSLRVDVLLLAECQIPPAALLVELNQNRGMGFHFCPGRCDWVHVYCAFMPAFLTARSESDRYTIRRLALPACPDILLAAAHLPSKLRATPSDQALAAHHMSEEIRRAESEVGHTRTVLVGDLNMQPFEEGVAGAIGFHAVSSRTVAARQSRTVDGREYPFFYNPMWGLYKEGDGRPPGTYYWAGGGSVAYFWHMLDQVLVRPALLDHLPQDGAAVVVYDGQRSLLDPGGLPDRKYGSDHLPIVFTLEL